MAWGKEWYNAPQELKNAATIQLSDADKEAYEKDLIYNGIAFTKVDETGTVNYVPLEKVYDNLSPTHDPYKNPNAHIYYECACGAILDPGTKSFAALNNCASKEGWKIRWGADSYKPYCVDCGKDVE